MSCDNMPSNGAAARTAVTSFARRRDELLARWIEDNVAFPSSMVDRITPETTDSDRRFVADAFGIEDRWPVVTEPFTQWIVEDEFCNGRPPLEEVGVKFVSDVEPYKLMKTRLLNASHSAIGYLGYLAGHRRTDEAMADPLMREYVARLMEDEIAPLVPCTPGIDLGEYTQTLRSRFANPNVGDRLERLCGRGSTKMPSYLLPSIEDARAHGRPHALLTLAVAGWLRYLRGVDFDGDRIEVKDALSDRLCPLAVLGGTDPRAILREHGVFGKLGRDPGFAASLEQALRDLDANGPRAALSAHLGRPAVAAIAA
jgi:fructuronate reductase/mannitol 2-dehydrogenase